MKITQRILLAAFAGMLASNLLAADQENKKDSTKPDITVRRLAFKPADRMFGLRFGGKNKVTLLKETGDVEKAFGKEQAQPLLDLVDFAKENIALVSWTTAGPPEGVLEHEIKTEENNRHVVFYVRGPQGNIRGMRARLSADFFAVSKGTAVSFDTKERSQNARALQ
ncbi:MAG: hypothetical protein RRC34_12590 [Lentisphaeria bacterium]|nr:hypothetical protein [Lentisphaeria bacterium]